MKYIKLALFILLIIFFVLVVQFLLFYILLKPILAIITLNTVPFTLMDSATIFLSILVVILGMIITSILRKAPKYYFNIFLSIIAISLLIVGVFIFMDYRDDKIYNQCKTTRDTGIQRAWDKVNLPNEAISIMKNIEPCSENDNILQEKKMLLYLTLALKDARYYERFLNNLNSSKQNSCSIIKEFSEDYTFTKEEEYIRIFKTFEDTAVRKNIYFSCINYKKKESFKFESLINRNFIEASIMSLQFENLYEYYFEKYLKIAKRIKNKKLRHRAISALLENMKIYEDGDDYTYDILSYSIVQLKNEEKFSIYTDMLYNRLVQLNSSKLLKTNDWKRPTFLSDEENFKEMVNILGKKHPIIKLIEF